MFADATPALRERIEQVVRLIRSKGVGVFFAIQNPLDLPDAVLGQLGNRIQHALRAFTPKDQKVIQAVAATFRAASGFDAQKAVTELAVGEALVSLLDDQGVPRPVQRVWIDPPRSRLAPLTVEERHAVVEQSCVFGAYENAVNRESAYEKLAARAAQPLAGHREEVDVSSPKAPAKSRPKAPLPQPVAADSPVGEAVEAFAKSAMRAAGSQIGRQIMRGLLDSMLGNRAPRRRKR